MNLRTITPLLALAALLSTGCRVTHTRFKTKDGILLRLVESEDGATVRYRLYWGGQAPQIHRTDTRYAEVANLGVSVSTVTGDLAERQGIPAFQGVFVDRVVADSPAARAGIRRGDVILGVGTATIASREQLEHVVQRELEIGTDVEIELARPAVSPAPGAAPEPPDSPGSPGSPGSDATVEVADERSRSMVLVTPRARRVEVKKTDVLALEHSPSVAGLTGMQIAGLSGDLADEIYESEEPLVLIAAVVPGSPAYRAGLRSGDRVLRCDGRSVRTVADLRRAVRARAVARSIRMDDSDEVSATAAMNEGSDWGDPGEGNEGPLRLDVDGPLGPHSTEVRVSAKIDNARRFKIPILVDYRSEVDRTRFAFLDFIFQFGWNYRSRYLQSSTRDAARSRYFSLFPFGMFECRTDPDSRQYTFLWFITVGSGR